MKSKLTLSVSPQAIQRGKRLARQRGESLSEMVSAYLEALEPPKQKTAMLDSRLEDCLGAYKLPAGKNVDDLRLRELLKKHGGKK